MCVDAIRRVKTMAKELRIEASLTSSRKMFTRSVSSSPGRGLNNSRLSVKHKSLAQLQEDMKSDFETAAQKECKQF